VDTVALAATIGGSVVGIVGILATGWAARQQRLASIELADAQHQHERALASGARLFEKRAEVYESLLNTLLIWRERVEHELPMMRTGGEPEPPEQPSQDEWRTMSARLGTFGSPMVNLGFVEIIKAINSFFVAASVFTTAREAGERSLPFEQVQAAREVVRSQFDALERLVSDELAGL
jgi:hypothetical protein